MSLTISVADIVEESNDPLLAVHPTWERALLRDVASVLNGFAFESSRFNGEKGMPLLRIRDVGRDTTECLYDGPYDEQYTIERGDFVVGMDGDFKCARWRGQDALLNQRVCKVGVTTKCYDQRFLELTLPGYLRAINERTSAQTVAHLSSKSLVEVPLPLPPLAEQRRIVAKVEELLAQVNQVRERLARVPAILKRFRQSVLSAACSGRLTEDWRDEHPDVEPASALLEKIAREQNAETHAGAERMVAGLPSSWGGSEVGFVTVNHDGRRVPIKSDDRKIRQGRYPYYGASGAIDTIDGFLFDGDFLLIGEDGANLLARSTPIAYQAHGRFWVNNHAHVLQARGGIPLEFLEFYVNGLDLQEYVTGSAQPKLTQANLNSIPVPLPPLDEQREIVRRVERLLRLADEIEQQVAAATKRVEKLTQAILAKAFRGELVPTEAALARKQGRSYEPASVLLERIKAGREVVTTPKPSRRRRRMAR